MQFTLNTKIILIAVCLMLVACAEETHAQQDVPVQQGAVKEQSELLEQRCKQLSSETGEDYQVVSGQVVRAGITPLPAYDCFGRPGCVMPEETEFFASINLLKDKNSSLEQIESYVYTKKELAKNLYSKNLYMTGGKKYEFCARKIDTEDNQSLPEKLKSKNLYQIDFVETIHELN